MIKYLVSIILLISLNTTLFAQEINLGKTDLESVLCQQWEIEYASMNGMKIGQMPGATDFDFKFESDGSYAVIRDDGQKERGTWVYDSGNKYVALSIKGKVTSRIISIDKTKLILTLVSANKEPKRLSGVEIHFKPI